MWIVTGQDVTEMLIRLNVARVALYVFLFVLNGVSAFNPSLTVDRCNKQSIDVTLSGGENGGLIYVQGEGVGCRQSTFTRATKHTFDFLTCNIEWGKKFRLVVQRKALYQTGEDKQFPITCRADLSDLDVNNGVGIKAKEDEASKEMMIKPAATMRLLSNGQLVGTTEVKLGDPVTMELKLETEYLEDFDILARSCTASNIDIISSYCPVETDLFPRFSRVKRGILSATFGAFRTTDFVGGSVAMRFACTLHVCLDNCTVRRCSDGKNGWGKKKRDTTLATESSPDHVNKFQERPIDIDETLTRTDIQRDDTSYYYSQSNTEKVADNEYDFTSEKTDKKNSPNATKSRKKVTKYMFDENKTDDVKDITVQGVLHIAADEVSDDVGDDDVGDGDDTGGDVVGGDGVFIDDDAGKGNNVSGGDDELLNNGPVVKKKTEDICMGYGVSVTFIVFMTVGLIALVLTIVILTRRGIKRENRLKRKRRSRDHADYYSWETQFL